MDSGVRLGALAAEPSAGAGPREGVCGSERPPPPPVPLAGRVRSCLRTSGRGFMAPLHGRPARPVGSEGLASPRRRLTAGGPEKPQSRPDIGGRLRAPGQPWRCGWSWWGHLSAPGPPVRTRVLGMDVLPSVPRTCPGVPPSPRAPSAPCPARGAEDGGASAPDPDLEKLPLVWLDLTALTCRPVLESFLVSVIQ